MPRGITDFGGKLLIASEGNDGLEQAMSTTTSAREIQSLAANVTILRNGMVLDTPEDNGAIMQLIKLGAVRRGYTCIPVPYAQPLYYVVQGYEKFFKSLDSALDFNSLL